MNERLNESKRERLRDGAHGRYLYNVVERIELGDYHYPKNLENGCRHSFRPLKSRFKTGLLRRGVTAIKPRVRGLLAMPSPKEEQGQVQQEDDQELNCRVDRYPSVQKPGIEH